MSRSNAERQKAYRDRKRNARNAPAGPIRPIKTRRRDYRDAAGVEHIWIGNFGHGDVYALVVNKRQQETG